MSSVMWVFIYGVASAAEKGLVYTPFTPRLHQVPLPGQLREKISLLNRVKSALKALFHIRNLLLDSPWP